MMSRITRQETTRTSRPDPMIRPRRTPRIQAVGLLFLAGCAGLGTSRSSAFEEVASTSRVGPSHGTLVVAGGGALGPEIWGEFLELAGGTDARIVVIPTAGGDDHYDLSWPGLKGLRDAGATNFRILHTRERMEANSDWFAEVIREADGVWFTGGRQWRLVDAYLATRVHEELFALLDRGGVIGGTSAGASIQGSFLVRGDPLTNQVVMSPDYEEGFGFLSGAAVDQHLLTRKREEDLWEILSLHPDLLGIGIDEGTAIVVRQDRARVIGVSQVLMYDMHDPIRRPSVFRPGDHFDLSHRGPLMAEDREESDLDPSPLLHR